MNKVKFYLKRAYYAPADIADDGTVTYQTPIRMPGAVSISFSPEGDLISLRADGCDYYTGAANNGYSGDLEMALIPDEFRVNCLGDELDGSKVLVEKATSDPKPFAFLYEFQGDREAQKHVMYLCTAKRANIEGDNPDTKTPKTETISIKAVPREIDDLVRCVTTSDTTKSVYDKWYESVYLPTESASVTAAKTTTTTSTTGVSK